MVECVRQAGYQSKYVSVCRSSYGSAGKKWNETEWSITTSNPKLERKKEKEWCVSGQARTGDLPRRKGSIWAYLLGGRDNHYTTETSATCEKEINVIKPLTLCFLPRARAIDSMSWDSIMILVNCLTSEYTAILSRMRKTHNTLSAFVFTASSTTDILASCKANVRCLG